MYVPSSIVREGIRLFKETLHIYLKTTTKLYEIRYLTLYWLLAVTFNFRFTKLIFHGYNHYHNIVITH